MGRSLTPVEIGVRRSDDKVYLWFWLLSVYEAGSGKVFNFPVVHDDSFEPQAFSLNYVCKKYILDKGYCTPQDIVTALFEKLDPNEAAYFYLKPHTIRVWGFFFIYSLHTAVRRRKT